VGQVRLLGMARAGVFRRDVSDAILNEMLGVLRDKFGWDAIACRTPGRKF
jgi:hypothetical protein